MNSTTYWGFKREFPTKTIYIQLGRPTRKFLYGRDNGPTMYNFCYYYTALGDLFLVDDDV